MVSVSISLATDNGRGQETSMTPEERQLLTTLADRVKSTPYQQQDQEAGQLLQQLVRERPDTAYILAQTVLMQDFALRNAQARIEELQRQASQPRQEAGSGSFLGGMYGGCGQAQPPRPATGSVPRVNPWAGASQERPQDQYAPPPPVGGLPPSGPVMQPSQTGGFLRNAAATAAGVAGGALLFQGINSLFSGHHGSLLGGDFTNLTPRDSLSETTLVDNNYGDEPGSPQQEHEDAGHGHEGSGLIDASYDNGDGDFDDGGGDYA
jgi:uncharacterized protein